MRVCLWCLTVMHFSCTRRTKQENFKKKLKNLIFYWSCKKKKSLLLHLIAFAKVSSACRSLSLSLSLSQFPRILRYYRFRIQLLYHFFFPTQLAGTTRSPSEFLTSLSLVFLNFLTKNQKSKIWVGWFLSI